MGYSGNLAIKILLRTHYASSSSKLDSDHNPVKIILSTRLQLPMHA